VVGPVEPLVVRTLVEALEVLAEVGLRVVGDPVDGAVVPEDV
jgi:hypothetical protein